MQYETIIIGGGVSGLAAAAFSRHALVLERMKQPGRKLLATGGGRCNITHDADVAGLMSKFGKCARFMIDALYTWDSDGIRAFFEERGVPTVVEDDGCVFPVSGRAGDVLDVLIGAAREAGAEIRCGVKVKRVLLDEAGTAVRGIETDSGEVIAAKRVILAAGGCCKPELGSDGSGFAMARDLGLKVTPVYPSLGSLVVEEKWVAALAGLSCPNAVLKIASTGYPHEPISGSLLFTHKGLSGPPALAISGRVAQALDEVGGRIRLKISFRDDRQLDDWIALFESWRRPFGTRLVRKLLAEALPKALAEVLCKLAGLEEVTTVANFNRGQTERLAELCAVCPVMVSATEGWDKAMMTRGGVALSELNPKSLMCKRIAGLYCVGELVDLDAPCGGYNLTWALASGRLAGERNLPLR